MIIFIFLILIIIILLLDCSRVRNPPLPLSIYKYKENYKKIFFTSLIYILNQNKVFYSCSKVPENELFKNNFFIIKKEFLQTFNKIKPKKWFEYDKTFGKQENYEVIYLKYFKIIEKNVKLFPKLYEIIKNMDNALIIYFAIMKGKTFLKPHRAFYNGVLRYHYPILIHPNDNSFIKINGIKKYWKENEPFLFDDTYEHFVIKNNNYMRVILIIDFIRPLPKLLQKINKNILLNSPQVIETDIYKDTYELSN